MNQTLVAKPGKQPLAGLALAWVVLVILVIALQPMVPAFVEVVSAFGSGLPKPTIFTMNFYRLAILLPLMAGLVWALWPDRTSKVRAAVIFCWLSSMLIVLMVLSLYLPIFMLGPVV